MHLRVNTSLWEPQSTKTHDSKNCTVLEAYEHTLKHTLPVPGPLVPVTTCESLLYNNLETTGIGSPGVVWGNFLVTHC